MDKHTSRNTAEIVAKSDDKKKEKSKSKKNENHQSQSHGPEEKPASSDFDLQHVCGTFLRAIEDPVALSLPLYLDAYTELNKFFAFFGRLFVFVSSDVIAKIEILREYHDTNRDDYATIQSMIEFERRNNLLQDTKRPSGARTLLRLHRALEFVSHFLRDVAKIENPDSTAPVIKAAYGRTLARHHPWYVRQAVYVAMFSGLPTRAQLLEKVYGDKKSNATSTTTTTTTTTATSSSPAPSSSSASSSSSSSVDSVDSSRSTESITADEDSMDADGRRLRELAQIADRVFGVTEKLYDQHKLLDLP